MRKNLSLVIALAVAVASIPLALAQSGQPSGQTSQVPTTNGSLHPANTVPGPAMVGQANSRLSPTDARFLNEDAQGAAYERELAEIAARRASDPKVKQYAAMIVRDHNEYNAALQTVGQDNGLALPTAPDPDQVKKLKTYRSMSGTAFDTAFAQEMARVNQQDVQEAQQEAQSTMNAGIRDFIERFKAMDQKHLQEAQQLQA